MNAHYEVRPAGEPRGEYLSRTGSNTEAEFNSAASHARQASLAYPGRSVEVRYQGYAATDLLVAAWLDGEPVDIRTQAKRDQEESR